MVAARAERFLNSRVKNPAADALCTREEGACPEKEAERTTIGKGRSGREDKDVPCFLSSCTRPETSTLPLFFQKTMSDSSEDYGTGDGV